MERSPANPYFTLALFLILLASVFSTVLTFQPSYGSHSDIEFELDNIEYGQGDEVTITGTIDGAQENDPVGITIHLAGAGSDSENTDINNDDGDFSAVYEISNSADDGIYEVEVEFEAEDPVSSFFLVDEDNNVVNVVTDEDIYQPGDDVVIEGDVEDPITGEEEVEITVIGPDGVDALGSEDVQLENDDTFRYDDLTLDNDLHGRYAVIVEYDNEELGFLVFEVEEDGGSSEFVSASLSKTSYKPGEEVVVSGEIDENDVDLIEVLVTVEDPSSDAIFDDSVRPDQDGSFEFSFDLEADAATGSYQVTLEYEGYDDKVLTFSVSTGTTSGGTGSGSASSGGLTAKINKVNFLAGETMTVTGVVPSINADEIMSIVILAPDGSFTGIQAFPQPDSNKEYSATLRLPSSLEVEDDYSVVVGYNGRDVEIEFDITGTSQDGFDGPITVETDKTSYSSGSTVKITGQVAEDTFTGGQLVLEVKNGADARYRYDLVTPSADGSYSYSMVVGGDLAVSGEWTVTAFYNQQKDETTFDLTGGPAAKPRFDLKIGNQTYAIEYEVTVGSIKSMFVKPTEKKLVISIDAEEDGVLTIVLPRQVIDAVEGGLDIKYVVATTDIDTGSEGSANVIESETTGAARTLVIEYEAGTDLLEILGTTVVPEFGSLSAIILAVSILSIIAITAKFSNGFSMLRQR